MSVNFLIIKSIKFVYYKTKKLSRYFFIKALYAIAAPITKAAPITGQLVLKIGI